MNIINKFQGTTNTQPSDPKLDSLYYGNRTTDIHTYIDN